MDFNYLHINISVHYLLYFYFNLFTCFILMNIYYWLGGLWISYFNLSLYFGILDSLSLLLFNYWFIFLVSSLFISSIAIHWISAMILAGSSSCFNVEWRLSIVVIIGYWMDLIYSMMLELFIHLYAPAIMGTRLLIQSFYDGWSWIYGFLVL